MNAEAMTCPPPDLAEFARGKLDAQRLEQVAAHLDGCATCQDTLVALAETSDTFVDGLHDAVEDPLEREAALRQGLRRIVAQVRTGRPAKTLSSDGAPEQIHKIGPYEIERRLGSGGMGTVFRAQHVRLKRTVALKILPANRWASAAAVSRFEREMEAIGQLDHPHIVRANDAGEDQGMHYLVMEFVDGLDLSRLARRLGKLPVSDACELARQAAIGLAHAHESGLVHRDVKPSNLILAWNRSGSLNGDARPMLKILDLGLALLGDEHLREDYDLTTVGQLMGTLDYMSPEQGIDSHSVDHRTDIYGLGATLFKLLTGQAPYADPKLSTLMKKMTALATKAAPSVGSVRDDLPADVVRIVDRMLARDPDERFDSAREVADALAPHAQGADLTRLLRAGLAAEEPSEPYESLWSRTPRLAAPAGNRPAAAVETAPSDRRTRRRGLLWLGGLAAAAVIAAGVIFRIATDFGEVVVRSDDPSVTVAIKRGDTTVDRLQLEQGEGRTRIRSGEYDVEIVGDATELSVIPGSITVRRGQPVSLSIQTTEADDREDPLSKESERATAGILDSLPSSRLKPGLQRASERATAASGNSQQIRRSQLTYAGKPAAYWFQQIATERQPEELKVAVEAMGALGRGALAGPSATAVLKVMRIHGSRDVSDSPHLISPSRQALLKMSPEAVASAIAEEVRAGHDLSSDFLVGFFRNWDQSRPGARRALLARFNLPQMIKSWVDAARDRPRQLGTTAELIALVCQRVEFDGTKTEGATELLLQALRERRVLKPLGVARFLVEYAPDTEGLVPALTSAMAVDDEAFVQIAELLPRLGPKAAPAVATLVDRLTEEFDKHQSGARYNPHNPQVSQQILMTLAALGPSAKEALPVLKGMRTSDNFGLDVGRLFGSPIGSSRQILQDAIKKISEGTSDDAATDVDGELPPGDKRKSAADRAPELFTEPGPEAKVERADKDSFFGGVGDETDAPAAAEDEPSEEKDPFGGDPYGGDDPFGDDGQRR